MELAAAFQCSQFCKQRAASCLDLAKINPLHHAALTKMATHWDEVASVCDRELHPWTEWCQSAHVD